jgi:hypothetical protein
VRFAKFGFQRARRDARFCSDACRHGPTESVVFCGWGRGWSNLWRDEGADRWDSFIRKKLELNTKSHFTVNANGQSKIAAWLKAPFGLWECCDCAYPPRQIGGFYKLDDLELLIQRRSGRKALGSERINRSIVERPYQHRAIRNVARSFEQDGERKALLVMATGSGKTRTVIALIDLLMRAGWVKRVLFLADRVALVNQAAGAFKAHLPDAAPVNLITERTSEGRVFLSTYPTMTNLIDGKQEGKARFGSSTNLPMSCKTCKHVEYSAWGLAVCQAALLLSETEMVISIIHAV